MEYYEGGEEVKELFFKVFDLLSIAWNKKSTVQLLDDAFLISFYYYSKFIS